MFKRPKTCLSIRLLGCSLPSTLRGSLLTIFSIFGVQRSTLGVRCFLIYVLTSCSRVAWLLPSGRSTLRLFTWKATAESHNRLIIFRTFTSYLWRLTSTLFALPSSPFAPAPSAIFHLPSPSFSDIPRYWSRFCDWVLYASRTLPPVLLRTFGPRPSLSSLFFGAAGRPHSAFRRNAPAANYHGVGRVRAVRLLHIPAWFQLK